ncbi:MAG: hypothetical protein JJ975_05400 [Bacteroidia bacterium]|nr:hypothetical protein [Bacteroidia bacterium]
MKFERPLARRVSGYVHFVLFLVLLIGFSAAKAQVEGELNSVRIELKSGLIIEGKLVRIEYQKEAEVLTPIGENIVVPWEDMAEMNFIENEIRKLQKERIRQRKPDLPFKDSGFVFSFEAGTPVGIDYWGDPVMGGTIQMSVSKGLGRSNSLGLVTGFEFYLWPDMAFVPFGIEYKHRFKPESPSWFGYFQAGYGSVVASEYTSGWVNNGIASGGVYFNPGMGFTVKRNEKRSWFIKMGYRYQTAYAEYDSQVWTFDHFVSTRIEEQIYYHRVDLRFGFVFN